MKNKKQFYYTDSSRGIQEQYSTMFRPVLLRRLVHLNKKPKIRYIGVDKLPDLLYIV